MKTVVDRVVQYPNRYKLTNVETGAVLGTFDFDEVTGTVQQVGTEIDAELFQSIADDLAARVKLSGGELKDTVVTFSDISGTAANVASGEKSSTLWGKVKNWFSRLKALAFKDKISNADVDDNAAIAQSKISGLTSALNGKQSTITGAASTIVTNNLTANRALISNASGKVAVSNITTDELNRLDGVKTNVQAQINNILNGITPVGKAENVTLQINGNPLEDIFENDGITVKKATYADNAKGVAEIIDNTTKIHNSFGGFAAGNSANVSFGGAIGSEAHANDGGAIGQNSSSVSGGAVGKESDTTIGGAVGQYANSYQGGAVGAAAKTNSGGAVGQGAESTTGFAGGHNAKATATGAVQLGTGTNNNANTLQFENYQVVDANGHIPVERLTNAPVTSVNGKTGDVSLNANNVNALPITGGTLTGNLTGKYITGTWLQATAANHQTSAASKIAVFDDSGWVYHRTASEIRSDIGAATPAQVNETSMVPDSGNATNLTVPASGGRVEIEADGWLCVNISRTTANGQFLTMTVQKEDGTDKWGCVNKSTTYFQSNYPVEFLPVKKGDYVRFSYNITPSRIQLIRAKQV